MRLLHRQQVCLYRNAFCFDWLWLFLRKLSVHFNVNFGQGRHPESCQVSSAIPGMYLTCVIMTRRDLGIAVLPLETQKSLERNSISLVNFSVVFPYLLGKDFNNTLCSHEDVNPWQATNLDSVFHWEQSYRGVALVPRYYSCLMLPYQWLHRTHYGLTFK